MTLETADFQAKDFYTKIGFEASHEGMKLYFE